MQQSFNYDKIVRRKTEKIILTKWIEPKVSLENALKLFEKISSGFFGVRKNFAVLLGGIPDT